MLKTSNYLLILLLIFPYSFSTIIQTSYGSIEGLEIEKNATKLHIFKRVPFAAPPVGELRFQKPAKPENWENVRNGREYGPACMSNSTESRSIQKWIDEDCLHLNIFTSEKCLDSKNCAVAFYIHGGGFNYDSAVMFNDTFVLETFVERDVILVITAFRLGIFSHFVVKNQEIAPNNLGLYDIIHALEFVNKEIEHFGGDNKKVTTLGHSYGGAITAAMIFSPTINREPSKSLFQQAISMSGGADFVPLDFQIYATRKFAKMANCQGEPHHSRDEQDRFMLDCLQKMDQFELLRIQRKMEEDGVSLSLMVQREPFFQGHKYPDHFKNPAKIPYMTGVVVMELDDSNDEIAIAAPLDYDNQPEIWLKYKEDKKNGRADFNHSDSTQEIFVDVRHRANQISKTGAPVYLYEYTYPKHAVHTDDLFYLMGVHVFEKDENEKHLAEVYRTIFTNFIKFGKPADNWDVLDPEVGNYYNVYWNEETGERPGMKNGFEKEIMDYWFTTMDEFDRNVTKARKMEKKTAHPSLRSFETGKLSYANQKWKFFFVISFIFIIGILIGRYSCKRPDKNVYVQLDGTDYDYQQLEDAIKTF